MYLVWGTISKKAVQDLLAFTWFLKVGAGKNFKHTRFEQLDQVREINFLKILKVECLKTFLQYEHPKLSSLVEFFKFGKLFLLRCPHRQLPQVDVSAYFWWQEMVGIDITEDDIYFEERCRITYFSVHSIQTGLLGFSIPSESRDSLLFFLFYWQNLREPISDDIFTEWSISLAHACIPQWTLTDAKSWCRQKPKAHRREVPRGRQAHTFWPWAGVRWMHTWGPWQVETLG